MLGSPPSSAPGGFLFFAQGTGIGQARKLVIKKTETTEMWNGCHGEVIPSKPTPPACPFFMDQFRVKVNEDLRGGVVRETGSRGATTPPPTMQMMLDSSGGFRY